MLRSIDEEILQLYYTNTISEDTYYLTSEIAFERLYKPVQILIFEPKRYFMKIPLKNKVIYNINICNILHNKLVRKTIPPYFDNVEVPMRNNIINYNDTISNLDLTQCENGIPFCNCDNSKCCYTPHGHVIMGDLNIINYKKRRSLVSKGPKYREQNIINWNINKRIIMDAIDIYVTKWCK